MEDRRKYTSMPICTTIPSVPLWHTDGILMMRYVRMCFENPAPPRKYVDKAQGSVHVLITRG